jgi:hypothetical protein
MLRLISKKNFLGSNSTRICMASEKSCFDSAKEKFESKSAREHCECFPACDSVKYSVEIKNKGIKR